MRTTPGKDIAPLAPRAWPQIVELAQQSLARMLAAAVADGRLDRLRYLHWLAMESATSRIGALALERVADWHGAQPPLRSAALGWATSLREDALAAAADVRALDGVLPPPPARLSRWHAYVESASPSPRAGEALGTALLHARLFQGAAHAATDLVLELPFLAQGGRSWLLRRRTPEAARRLRDRETLLDAWSAMALAAGAQRAAAWHGEALAEVLGASPVAPGRAAND